MPARTLFKAGLMEVGDIFVVNKADRSEAARLYAQLLASLRLRGNGQEAARQQVEDALMYDESDPIQRVLQGKATITRLVEELLHKIPKVKMKINPNYMDHIEV